MYCKNCGKEIDGDLRFCGNCGAALQYLEPSKEPLNMQQTPATQDKGSVAAASTLAQEGKSIVLKFFTKDSSETISDAAQSNSPIWIMFVAINSLLFALAACLNMSQMANHFIKSLTNFIAATVNSVVGSSIAGSIAGSEAPQIPMKYFIELFVPLTLLALIVLAAEFAGIYIALKIDHRNPKKYSNVANVVGVASLPLSVALISNLIIGLIYPPATLLVFGTAFLLDMVMIYDGVKNILECEKAPVKEFAIIAALLCLIVLIAFSVGTHQVGQIVQSTINSAIGGNLKDGLGSIFGSLLG